MSFTEKLELNVRRAWKPYEMYGPSIAIYTVVLSLIFALLSVVRMKLAGPSATLAAFAVSLIDNLSAAVIAAVIAALLLFFLFPKARLKEELAVLDSWNIGPVLKAPLERTNTYYFRGRSGRWLRSTVLPALFDAAGRESVTRSVHLLLPNPEDVGLLKSYADYRNSLSSGKTDVWTLDRIRNEIVATLRRDVTGQFDVGQRELYVSAFLRCLAFGMWAWNVPREVAEDAADAACLLNRGLGAAFSRTCGADHDRRTRIAKWHQRLHRKFACVADQH